MWAAVAVIVSADRRVLFIRRTRRPGDPWAGDMAFPGGFRSLADAVPLDTARREVLEEIGLALGAPSRRLPWRWAFHPGTRRPCRLQPYVFAGIDPSPLRLEPTEVAEAVWIPLSHLADPRVRRREPIRVQRRWPWLAVVRRFERRRIWGLTGRMVDDLVTALGSGREER